MPSLSFFYSTRPRVGDADKAFCCPSEKGKCSFILSVLTTEDSNPFPWEKIWRTKAPPKAVFVFVCTT